MDKAKMTSKKKVLSDSMLIKKVAESFLASGDLDAGDLKNPDKLPSKLKELSSKLVYIQTDHTEDLLEHAAHLALNGKLDLSIMLYATYFEHGLNLVIDHTLRHIGVSKKTKVELIRAVNIAGKCSWILELLGLPKFNTNHQKVISKLSNERNAFVHYKWDAVHEDNIDADVEEAEKVEIIKEASKTARYMKGYISKILFKGEKKNLKKALKDARNNH